VPCVHAWHASSATRRGEHRPDPGRSALLLVCLEVECQPASRLSLRICLSKAREGTMRRSVLTRPAVEPAV
jgi:hypothetical protein